MTATKSVSALIGAAAAFVILWIAIPMAGELFDSNRPSWETMSTNVMTEPVSQPAQPEPTSSGGTEAVPSPSGHNAIRTVPQKKQHSGPTRSPGISPGVPLDGMERLDTRPAP